MRWEIANLKICDICDCDLGLEIKIAILNNDDMQIMNGTKSFDDFNCA